MGENNLIFTSVVLGDLINRCEDNALEIYNALLVEEPEAHLHPQYQNTFFEYLNAEKSKGLQVFVTSHSPTITAKSDVNNISVLQRKQNIVQSFSFGKLTESDYPAESKRHLRKFLDTTKAQLFFANGVLLVEGVAEAIIIPILAKKFLSEKIDMCKSGIELLEVSHSIILGYYSTMMMRASDFCQNVRLLQTAIPKKIKTNPTERKKLKI